MAIIAAPVASNTAAAAETNTPNEAPETRPPLRLVSMADMPMPTVEQIETARAAKEEWSQAVNASITQEEEGAWWQHCFLGDDAKDFETQLRHTAIEYETGARPRYGDIAALLAGTLPEPPTPSVLLRDDGRHVFYSGALNIIYGDPESAKTWIALAAIAETLIDGGAALFVDMDHNGMESVVARLLKLGAPPAALASKAYFRYSDAADPQELAAVILDCKGMATIATHDDGKNYTRTFPFTPDVAVLDCSGEIIAAMGGDSNNAEDFTKSVQQYMRPLMKEAESCVILIDHSGKALAARKQGAAGTFAKRRVVDGLYVEARVKQPFVKGRGGITELIGMKDRHSGVREHSASMPDGRFNIGQFELTETAEGTSWNIVPPSTDQAADESGIAERRANDYLPAVLKIGATGGEFTVRDLAKARFGGGPVDRAAMAQARRGMTDLVAHGITQQTHAGDRTHPARYVLTEAYLGKPPGAASTAANTPEGEDGAFWDDDDALDDE